MHRLRSVFACLILTSAAVAAADDAPLPPAAVGAIAAVDRLVATVDGVAIWRSQVDDVIAPMLAGDPRAFRGELEPKVIDKLVDDALVVARARALHVETDDAEIDRAIKEVEAQNQLDDAGLEAALTAQGYTRARYRVAIAQQLVEGKTFQAWLRLQPRIAPTETDIDHEVARLAALDKAAASSLSRDKVKDELVGARMQAAHATWLAELHRAARIEVR